MGKPLADSRTGTAPATEQYIAFDTQQLVVRTDVAEIFEFVCRIYRSMLVPRVTSSVGWIEARRRDDGFVLRSADELYYYEDLDSTCRYLRRHVHMRFIRRRSDLIWLHAGAVEKEGRCLLIAGPTRHGKSSLVTLLCERGWRMLSDDVAPLRMDTLKVLPYPERPVRRVYPGRDLPLDHIGSLVRESVHVADESICRTAAVIGGIVFPVFRGGQDAELARLSAGETALELVRNCTNFTDHKAVAVTIASKIAGAVAGDRLLYGQAAEAAKLLDSHSLKH